jgi:hypothetical protein
MRKATLFLSWSMLAGLCMVRAGDPTDPKEQAWKPLFDGKTMDGWQPADLYKPGPCSVKDGALCLKNGKPGENGPMTGIVSTRKDLPKKDYELRFQARRVEGDDFFATVTFPVGGSHCSFVTGGWGGETVGLSTLDGMDASENDTSGSFAFEKGKWYTFRVRVSEKRIQTFIGDKRLVNVGTEDRKVSIRLECMPCRPLGVATYRTTGEVKSMEIRPLTAGEVAEMNKKSDE